MIKGKRIIEIIAFLMAFFSVLALFGCVGGQETESGSKALSESTSQGSTAPTETTVEAEDSQNESEPVIITEISTEKLTDSELLSERSSSETEFSEESHTSAETEVESDSADGSTVDSLTESTEDHETTEGDVSEGLPNTSETEEQLTEEATEVGLDITNRENLVSICYSVWFDGILGEGDEPVTDFYNIAEVLAGRQEWGAAGQFHYWGKPAQGYYRSTDKKAIRNNMTLLAAAGIDFIILDYTNANDSYVTNAAHGERWAFAPLRALCETVTEMREEGNKTPYIVLWCGQSDGALIDAFYNRFYTVEEWKDCFVYWDGKPFMITTKPTERFPRQELFTVRHMWGLTSDDCWKFLNVSNGRSTVFFNGDEPEQISVAVATQETYMSYPTAHGRNGGRFFYDQWKNAFKFHPKVVTVTWWNEWAAQRFIVDGETTFVDNYTQEYSRDIEPMEGGHGDLYYRWLCEYVRAYKAGEDCPKLYVTEE